MSRATAIALAASSVLTLAGLACAAPPVAPAPAPRPNVLLILADDLGWSDLGCYGSEIQTPNLDALAGEGLRFTQFYNSARCSPSRASLLTGLHPHQVGVPVLDTPLNDQCVTLPEVLKPAGYNTYMVGKWHLTERSTPTMRGFDEFYGMLGGFNTYWQEHPYQTRLPAGHPTRTYAPGEFYSTNAFGDYALDFLEQGHKSGKPWFMYLAFNAGHLALPRRRSPNTKRSTTPRAGTAFAPIVWPSRRNCDSFPPISN
jgi:arylsulfatase